MTVTCDEYARVCVNFLDGGEPGLEGEAGQWLVVVGQRLAVSWAGDMQRERPVATRVPGRVDTRLVDKTYLPNWCREVVFRYEFTPPIRLFAVIGEHFELISTYSGNRPRRMLVRTGRPSRGPISERAAYSQVRVREKRDETFSQPITFETTEFPGHAVQQELVVDYGGCYGGSCTKNRSPFRVRLLFNAGKLKRFKGFT